MCVNITDIDITDVNITDIDITDVNVTQVVDCGEQDEWFSLIFTIASVIQSFLTFSNGFVLDQFGTTVARLGGIILYTTGTLMIAFSTPALYVLLYPALTFIAVGGSMFLITNMQVGNLFRSRRSTVITLYSGAYGSSAALFLIIKVLYTAGISLYASFLFLSACSVIHLLRTLFLMPRTLIPYPLPEHYTYGIICGESNSASAGQTEGTSNRNNILNQEKSFRECLLSRFSFCAMVWLSVMQLRNYLFIGTLNPMLQRLADGDHSLVSHYTTVFALTQLCGVLCSPWNGFIMDRHKGKPRAAGESERDADLRASVLSLFLTPLLCILFSICATIPILPLQYLSFVLQVITRSFLYSGLAAFITMAFPSCHFGKLYGFLMAVAGLVSLLQYACFILVENVFDGDPLYVNIALTLLIMFAFIHPLSVYLHCRSLASQPTNQPINQPTNTHL
ncbi:solute carrier family 43 member 3-like [Sphaeramia orbicularis]|uniref:solute carrier family 43 member 3-like n=1 Tax=Sphaeramia orbicularis TaxID=375764 RepID=UPI001180D52B|nr:solute carrier family 43 member 3-like [Sphaeramia orbicularis]